MTAGRSPSPSLPCQEELVPAPFYPSLPSFSDDWKGRRRRGEHLQLNAPFLPLLFLLLFPFSSFKHGEKRGGEGREGCGIGQCAGTDLLVKLDIFFAMMLGPAYVYRSISHTYVLILGDFHSPPLPLCCCAT